MTLLVFLKWASCGVIIPENHILVFPPKYIVVTMMTQLHVFKQRAAVCWHPTCTVVACTVILVFRKPALRHVSTGLVFLVQKQKLVTSASTFTSANA